MSKYIYLTIAAILCAIIEWARWKISYGKYKNLNKSYTYAIAIGLFIACCFTIGWSWQIIFLIPCFGGIRGTLYDPLLNIFMDRYIDEESYTTNSWIDQKEQQRKINFWLQRIIYLAVAVVFALLFEWSKTF